MASEKRLKEMAAKRARKATSMQDSGGTSKYARKAQFLRQHGGFGYDYGHQDGTGKPWN